MTLSGLTTSDVLDLSADSDLNLQVAAEAANTDVTEDGEWHYDNGTGVVTYWDAVGSAQTIIIDAGLTLTTTGNDEVVTIG